jgi:hypothetical protein
MSNSDLLSFLHEKRSKNKNSEAISSNSKNVKFTITFLQDSTYFIKDKDCEEFLKLYVDHIKKNKKVSL